MWQRTYMRHLLSFDKFWCILAFNEDLYSSKISDYHHLNLHIRTEQFNSNRYTVNPLYNDIRYGSKIRYNVNLVCTKISGSCMFSLIFPCYSPGKHTFYVFVRIASPRRFYQYTKRMIHDKICSKVSNIHALDWFISSFFKTANSI